MSMTTIAVSSTATRIGSGRAGRVTMRLAAISRPPPVSTAIGCSRSANVGGNGKPAQALLPLPLAGETWGEGLAPPPEGPHPALSRKRERVKSGGEVAGVDEVADRPPSARRFACARSFVEHGGIADAADRRRRLYAVALR